VDMVIFISRVMSFDLTIVHFFVIVQFR